MKNLPYRLLRYRLEEGPKVGWQPLDLAFRKMFEKPLVILPAKADILAILDTLRTENWGDEGDDLRVRGLL